MPTITKDTLDGWYDHRQYHEVLDEEREREERDLDMLEARGDSGLSSNDQNEKEI